MWNVDFIGMFIVVLLNISYKVGSFGSYIVIEFISQVLFQSSIFCCYGNWIG